MWLTILLFLLYSTIKADDFTKKLFDIYEVVRAEGYAQVGGNDFSQITLHIFYYSAWLFDSRNFFSNFLFYLACDAHHRTAD